MSLLRITLPLLFSVFVFAAGVRAQSFLPDVTSYELTIEPDIKKGTVTGSVVIRFQVDKAADSVVFNSGNLQVDKVSGNFLAGYKSRGNILVVRLMKKRKHDIELTVDYHGKPANGVVFDAAHDQAYTVFSTSQWMVCNDDPSDKAKLNLKVIAENDQDCVGSGVPVGKEPKDDRAIFSFVQYYETPTYTYGFSIGKFNQAGYNGGSSSKVSLKFYGQRYSPDDLRHIFRETSTIMSFFEAKSGIFYPQATYTQVLIGDHYQEMSGLSVLKESYGRMVLLDSTEINLISHELAHQWWGNRITCKTWGHFWLNEGMATFMSAAFNEYRFGEQVYRANIESYRKIYDGLKQAGKDRSLVYDDWSKAAPDDRNLVYFKGAYVIYQLREKLGDEKFWKAIGFYSSKYNGGSVVTKDFQRAIEESSGVSLQDFFNEWVYVN